jgi:hypothetical protein
MKRTTFDLVVALAIVISGCNSQKTEHRVGGFAPSGRVISFDPSVNGLDAAVGDVVQLSGGTAAWVKTGTGLTAWQTFPGASTVSTDSTLTGNGSSLSPLSVVSIGWDAAQWNFITSKIPGQVSDYDWSDLLHPYEYDITHGDHPAAIMPTVTGGVIWAPHGNTGTAYLALAGQSSFDTGNTMVVKNMKTEAWAAAFRYSIAVAPGAGTNIWIGMFTNAAGEPEVWCGINGSISTTVFQLELDDGTVPPPAASGSAACTVGSGITVGTPFDMVLINDVTNGSVSCYVNKVLCASTTTLTHMPTQVGAPTWFISGAQHIVHADKMLVTFNTPQGAL